MGDSIRGAELEKIANGLRSGFIDSSSFAPEGYKPRLIANDKYSGVDLLSVLKEQLGLCDRFDICVAFVAESGLQPLVEALLELRDRGVRGRLLTSTYLNFNTPHVFRKLMEFDNIDVRVYQGNLHAKGYVFDREGISTVIVGSSNLTQMALTCNREWNVLFRSSGDGEMLAAVRSEFDALWNDSHTVGLSYDWTIEYDGYRSRNSRDTSSVKSFQARRSSGEPIQPNNMQERALEALAKLHERKEPRALLVSATGTGKTYLSAFDVQEVNPRRVLFLVHRRRILEASKRSFEKLLAGAYTYGIYDPGRDWHGSTCLFAMCSTIVNHLSDFEPSSFDYIVIDEAHRAGSRGYQQIMQFFTPTFYLGMTATPQRTDGYDVFALFNHVIAYQITLQDALANNMLSPFHYFGIADLKIDDADVDDPSLFTKLTSDERVRHIVTKIEEYSVRKEGRRGLIFCNRVDEASELSSRFNELGYKTCALSGSNSDAERDEAIARLEAGDLEYIFSVDVMNEGVDIPSLNQIIMLRRTESAIVFVQQLGRGLRKSDDKEFLLVLDFIGNYQKNFLVPIALTGDRTYNKDNLRAIVKEGNSFIPGCSTVSFDKVSEARIYKAIDGGDFSSARLLKEEYGDLRRMLGRIPKLSDFDRNGSIDPLRIFNKFGSYHAFLSKYEDDYNVRFSEAQEGMLSFVSRRLASGKRSEELVLLKSLIENVTVSEVESHIGLVPDDGIERALALKSAGRYLSGHFSSPKGFVSLVTVGGGHRAPSDELRLALNDPEFRNQLLEVIEFGLSRFESLYKNVYRGTSLVLYAKYTYEEVCHLLNWDKNINGQNIGGYMYDQVTKTFPVFINYEKDPEISETMKYEDRFVSDREIIALSKQSRTLASPEIQRLKGWPSSGVRPYLFVRKNKNDRDGSKEFYFLGEIRPTGEFRQIVMPGTTKSAVEITYELRDSVRRDLYEYLTGTLEAKTDDDL
ncbi:DEAD/DEAH box helicase [Thermophilibacter provencensis]|uniref:DEAD/DEAH box helicase n=1 Tax=Thermophilibacter provencensis TaxID=1852386 RepID=UPI002942702E|nr:DEAD/DEAH box helicase [Thermophilibacter provencensis]